MLKKRFFLFTILLIVFTAISVSYFGKLIDDKMADYVTEEVNKVSKILIRKILNDDYLKKINLDDLFTIDKDGDEIKLINFNTIMVNNILGKTNDEILYYFNEFDHGNAELINNYSDIFQKYIVNKKRGLFINVPIGIIFSNPILFSVGPSIPIKILLTGQVESNLVTSLKQYGINNALLEVSIGVNVKEKIIFPFSNRYVDVYLEIPLVIELISGKVPENYLNSQNSDIIR